MRVLLDCVSEEEAIIETRRICRDFFAGIAGWFSNEVPAVFLR